MDEEQSFANLLSSTAQLRPTWSPPRTSASEVDPWANPFASSSPTNPFSTSAPQPFASSTISAAASTDVATSTFLPSATLASDDYGDANGFQTSSLGLQGGFGEAAIKESPYVQKLEENAAAGSSHNYTPEPPSVIAAREAETYGSQAAPPFSSSSPTFAVDSGMGAQSPSASASNRNDDPFALASPGSSTRPGPSSRDPLAGLIDEDLMAASDPSISLKRAFVKSTPSKPRSTAATGGEGVLKEEKGQKAYVFSPGKGKQANDKVKVEAAKVKAPAASDTSQSTVNGQHVADSSDDKSKTTEVPTADRASTIARSNDEVAAVSNSSEGAKMTDVDEKSVAVSPAMSTTPSKETGPTHLTPASIPLPDSTAGTPSVSRVVTPAPPLPSTTDTSIPEHSPALPAETPRDRVAVSPLEPPTATSDFNFKALSIGAGSPLVGHGDNEGSGAAWDQGKVPSPVAVAPVSRFGGRGWGALDEEDEEKDDSDGLFGVGGPAGKDVWGATENRTRMDVSTIPEEEGEGWGENTGGFDAGGPSGGQPSSPPPLKTGLSSTVSESPSKPSHYRRKTHPVFTINISDPARVGDPVRGYTVYTIRTRTTSPHYRKSELTALRRFSDFLWLYDALVANNPGVIIPPVPDKHTFGRFQEQFIETRRLALQRSLTKITSHPVLQLDPDLRLFLESDNFTVESRQRPPDPPDNIPGQPKGGLLSGWTGGPKYVETDDWFTSRSSFLDALESQLKALSKSIELASKSRLEFAAAMNDYASSMTALAESDLGSAMCAALARLADLGRREKEVAEELAKGDVVHLLNMADEYVRFVGSVRVAMGGRVRSYWVCQGYEKELARLKSQREKLRVQGKLGDRAAQTLAEINEVDRRARDAKQEFETLTKLVKSEFARFERERVDEFKRVMERHLDGQLEKQKELIAAWEEYHGVVLRMVQKAQGSQSQAQAKQGQQA